MKKFLNKVSVLMMGCVMAMMATACHTGGDDVTTTKVTPTVKTHSVVSFWTKTVQS